jgi:hypothetical protein
MRRGGRARRGDHHDIKCTSGCCSDLHVRGTGLQQDRTDRNKAGTRAHHCRNSSTGRKRGCDSARIDNCIHHSLRRVPNGLAKSFLESGPSGRRRSETARACFIRRGPAAELHEGRGRNRMRDRCDSCDSCDSCRVMSLPAARVPPCYCYNCYSCYAALGPTEYVAQLGTAKPDRRAHRRYFSILMPPRLPPR